MTPNMNTPSGVCGDTESELLSSPWPGKRRAYGLAGLHVQSSLILVLADRKQDDEECDWQVDEALEESGIAGPDTSDTQSDILWE
ncbi:uncharacterized [Tachysurus ichikawai]